MNKKLSVYLLHALGGLLFLSIPVLAAPNFGSTMTLLQLPPFQRSFMGYVLLLVFFYVNYLYFLPKFYFNRKYWQFCGLIVISYIIIRYIPSVILPEELPKMAPGKMPPEGRAMVFRGMPGPMGFSSPFMDLMPLMGGSSVVQFILVLSLSFMMAFNYRLAKIKEEKLSSEVSYLRAQINPHFLFNTLNSVYSLALRKSDAAPEAILKLSSMMRYVVTESSRDRVALEKEIDYIKNYISLQQLRIDGNAPFTFIITGDASGKYISPLLLIPFIENAFKYGFSPEAESEIAIRIDINADGISLNVSNSKVNNDVPESERSGHGIENTRNRLEYLYAGKHELRIFDKQDTFEVALLITLI